MGIDDVMKGAVGAGPGPIGEPGEEPRRTEFEASAQAALELREALQEECDAEAKLLEQNPSLDDLRDAAKAFETARCRVEAARARVGAEVGAMALPVLRDERPRFYSDQQR